jgi:uncharacterized protein DUF1236
MPEHVRDRPGGAEVAAVLGEHGADGAARAVAVVGQRLDDHRHAARTVALVANGIVALSIAARGLLDGALDVVLGHVLGPRRLDGEAQARVHVGVGHAGLGRHRDLAGELGEDLGADRILPPLAVHDVLELRMASHGRCVELDWTTGVSEWTVLAPLRPEPSLPGAAEPFCSIPGKGSRLAKVNRIAMKPPQHERPRLSRDKLPVPWPAPTWRRPRGALRGRRRFPPRPGALPDGAAEACAPPEWPLRQERMPSPDVTRNSEASPGEDQRRRRSTVMMRHVWTSAAAGVALLGTSALVGAQQVPDRGSEPSARERSPDGKGQRAPGAQQPGKDGSGATEPRGDGSKGVERPDKDRPRTTDRPDKDRPKGAERPDKDRPRTTDQPDKDRPKGAERPDKDRPRTTDRPDKDRPKGAERPDKDRSRTADQPDKDRPKGAERPDKTRPGVAQPDTDKGASGRVQVSEPQRSEIRTKLQGSRVERTRLQVNVNVGSRVPRSVRLHPLPSAIIALAPAFRGRSYFVRDDDTIVIVDARTYVVVDVIPAGTRVAGLSLSPDQMRFIYARVPKDRSMDIRVRLGLGAEVPPDVELRPFPPEVLARIPEVEDYRYVVANRDVAIVDPKDHSIALVISE